MQDDQRGGRDEDLYRLGRDRHLKGFRWTLRRGERRALEESAFQSPLRLRESTTRQNEERPQAEDQINHLKSVLIKTQDMVLRLEDRTHERGGWKQVVATMEEKLANQSAEHEKRIRRLSRELDL